MSHPRLRQAQRNFGWFLAAFLGAALLGLVPTAALAGGPKYVAGTSGFNSSVLGQPVHWANGQVNYYVDQGPLNGFVTNQQAVAMVDAAAALWSAIPTTAVTLTDKGTLNEDVSGANIVVSGTNFTVTNEQTSQLGVLTAPADVAPSATGYPLGIIFDADGSVIDAVFGAGASLPTSCQNNGVLFWLDSINPNATIAHGIILLNGLCATTPEQLEMMSFQLERAFGRILGLDYAQVNTGAESSQPDALFGWPVMQPASGDCGSSGGLCIPDPTLLRWDDVAALNRIYPVTAANLASFPGKQITAANTISIQGTILFSNGVGMQGVNVVARPLDANGDPLYQYTTSFVSGSYFNGNHGDPVTGWNDANGNPLTMWGSNAAAMQGYYDLSGVPLPPGATTASYQLSFESVHPQNIHASSVGPYLDGSPETSGTLATISVPLMPAGGAQTINVTVENSAVSGYNDALGSESAPLSLPASGMWNGRLSQLGQTDWLSFPVQGGSSFTVVTEALDESGNPTNAKAMPALGVWDAYDALGTAPVGFGAGLNGLAAGQSWLQVAVSGSDVVRLGINDERGDGRPDYAYRAWVLYATGVSPQRLPLTGGAITITGMGFHPADTVQVGGQSATVLSITPNQIIALAPSAASGITGSVNVEIDDLPIYNASTVLAAAVGYGSDSTDALTLLTAPMGSIPVGVPQPFTVTALAANLAPAGGDTVLFTVTSGTAKLGCGTTTCAVTATGDGRATINVTAIDDSWSIVTASLNNGSSLQTQFGGTTPPTLASLTPMLSLAAGTSFAWTTQVLALSGGLPVSGLTVTWQTTSGLTASGSSATTNANGIAALTLTAGPLTEGQTVTATACLSGSSSCVTFTAFGARPEYSALEAVSGVTQNLSAQATASPIVLRVLDMDGNPMTGATVTLYQALYAWAPPCGLQGPCEEGALLAQQSSTATSALDGSVSFTPASLPGVATDLLGLAVTGNTGSISIAIEQGP
jgi:hypothetical protein